MDKIGQIGRRLRPRVLNQSVSSISAPRILMHAKDLDPVEHVTNNYSISSITFDFGAQYFPNIHGVLSIIFPFFSNMCFFQNVPNSFPIVSQHLVGLPWHPPKTLQSSDPHAVWAIQLRDAMRAGWYGSYGRFMVDVINLVGG